MNKLGDLLAELCPDGVEYKQLSEVATISRGGNFQKKDYVETGFPCIHYGQIYTKYNLFINKTISHISQETAEKQKKAVHGDIIMAVTSENIEDVCKCVAWLGEEDVAVSGHTAIIHHTLNPKYLVYYLTSSLFFKQKLKMVQGTKVIEVSPSKLGKVKLPVPPLEIQREIVRILDQFTEYTAELTTQLTAELTARKKQYEYYRDELLTHECATKLCALKDVCLSIADGDHMPPPKSDFGVPFITISNITENKKIDFSNVMYVPREYYDKLADKRRAKQGDILYTVVGSFGTPVYIAKNIEFVFQRHIAILRPNTEKIIPRYMYHAMQSTTFYRQADKAAKGAAQRTIGLASLGNMQIFLPSFEDQHRIVSILDRFDALCNDLTSGLPAEIEARRKQYEYYRDKLLTFKKKASDSFRGE